MRTNSLDHHSDEDDDLRSLLSGNSGGLQISHPPLRQKQQQKQSQQNQQKQSQQPQLGQQQGEEGHSTQVSSSEEDDNENTMRSISNDSTSNNGNSNSINNSIHNSTYKKTLWILGTIILAMGFLGPSGLLWDILDDGEYDADSMGYFSEAHGDHGDSHHKLSPPPPPSHMMDNDNNNVHPMIRSAHAMERATSGSGGGSGYYPQHTKFGTAKRKKKHKVKANKNNDAKSGSAATGGGGWGIKEAIDNIDKIFLDNRPLPASSTTKKEQLDSNIVDLPSREVGSDDFVASDDRDVLPVVHYSDGDPESPESQRLDANDQALDTYTYTQLPASDALECRASVVAFVINATDVRDECDGLRKAFDKTCSVVHQVESGGGSGGGTGTAVVEEHQPRQHAQRRRRLEEWGRPRLVNLIPEAFRREAEKAGGVVRSHFRGGRRLLESQMVERRTEDAPEEHPIQQQQQPPPKQEQQAPMISLNIPTADKHISEEMLTDTLLLQDASDPSPVQGTSSTSADGHAHHHHHQQTDQQMHQNPEMAPGQSDPASQAHDGQAAPEAAPANNPNITAASAVAIQDAAESAGAIRTAVETVKNSMNKDPKSVEARTCCASILSVFHEHCDPTTTGVEDYSDRRLLVVVFVITVCGLVKSLIRHLGIRWLPEAGGCILVGVFGYLILEHLPHVQFAFDGDMFLRIMVPPIVFEAAVKINKQAFRRHIIPIVIFSIVGTLASTAFTAFILHKGSSMLKYVTTIPIKESLIFGALISSIDPIAVLSVLNNMGMSDTDTIYVLIFGESLLNDGVAIVLFQTLVHFLDESLVIDSEVVGDAFMHFVVVALGSVTVGVLAGACATVYFSLMHGCQTPMVEVIMFCCWSFIPYYICDMVEWSGIVAIVANGFVMDLYVIGQKHGSGGSANVDNEIDFLVNGIGRTRKKQSFCQRIFNYEGHLSQKADNHVHFVIEIFATLMETAIFSYLGLFLFSPRYHWSGYLTLISIFATVMGRVIMIPLFSQIANILNRMSQSSTTRNFQGNCRSSSSSPNGNANSEGVHIDKQMQLVLVFAGLRGAMSFALVEHIPMFDTTTGQGSRLKPELKAMTSAGVIFTVFVLGGATSYLMEKLGYSLGGKQPPESLEIVPLVHHEKRKSPAAKRANGGFSLTKDGTNSRNISSVRQRGPR